MDWTLVTATTITTVGTIVASYFSARANHRVKDVQRQIKTPSDESIGSSVERTHHLAEAQTILVTEVHNEVVNGGNGKENK